MSTRNDILDNLVTALEAISGVGKVSREWVEYPQLNPGDFPALTITDSGGEQLDRHCTGGQCTMLIMVLGYFKDATDTTSRFSTFYDLVWDAIYAPISLGSAVRDCQIRSVDPINVIAQDNVVEFFVNLEIKFVREL
jgi:hypothetical protein